MTVAAENFIRAGGKRKNGRRRGGSEAGERWRRIPNNTEVVVKRTEPVTFCHSASGVSNHQATLILHSFQ